MGLQPETKTERPATLYFLGTPRPDTSLCSSRLSQQEMTNTARGTRSPFGAPVRLWRRECLDADGAIIHTLKEPSGSKGARRFP